MASSRKTSGGAPGEQGFSVVEVVVAITILFVVMVSLAHMVTNGLTDVAFGKQRQVASSLMNKTMEEIRALPFAEVAAGLSDADMSDPAFIKKVGSDYIFIPNGEKIPHYSTATGKKPLYPHRSTQTLNGTTYTIGAYPTYTFPAGVFRVTVVVRWGRTFESGLASQVTTQSLVYSPEGCLSRTTHPFGAPCQPFFYGQAATGSGFFRVSRNPAASAAAIFGMTLNRAEITLPSASSSIQIEQISTILGSLQSAGALLDIEGQVLQRSGAKAASASADNDPSATAGTETAASDLPAQDGTPLTHSSSAGTITVAPTSTDTGDVTSTAFASTAVPCRALTGSSLTTSLPCGSGAVRPSGSDMSASLELNAGTDSLGVIPLGSASAPPSASRVATSRHIASGTEACTVSSGDGCIHAGARREIGTVKVAGLPPRVISDGRAPAGWGATTSTNYLFKIEDYSDEVRAESGFNSTTPTPTATVPATGGTIPKLTYWNGAGYSSVALNWGASPPAISIAPVLVVDLFVDGAPLKVSIDAVIDTAGPTTSVSTHAGCPTACTASASSPSPVIATVSYAVDWGGVPLANLVLTLDLGSMLAKSSYKAAPSAG